MPSNGGSAIQGYNVWRGTTSGGETQVATLGNVLSFTDTGRTNGTTYFYKVTARNAVGEGVFSNELSATPVAPPDSTAPSKPGGMDQLIAGTNQQVIAWNASTDNVGVTGYDVYRNGGLVATDVKTTYFLDLDSNLLPYTIYTYQVRAVDAAGNRSPASNSLSARTANQTSLTTGTLRGVAFDSSGEGISSATASFTRVERRHEERQRQLQGRLGDLQPRTRLGHADGQRAGVRDAGVQRDRRRRQDDAGPEDTDLGAPRHLFDGGRLTTGPRRHCARVRANATMRAATRNTESGNNGRLG